ncbi:type III-B CRISPR module-associated protein Cmr5 [Thermanaerothrix sp. 4228-RoL]|uniref:CRISPR type III-B/RAMP module-associated protein Cmr5 n=1 Tax=Thermanaerothrix solaris TaxID=3058434 RepID=A0ABU3NLA0_9CHLR|nr:type III-B CRISPR module-associated protein Cmr5 [Thermanaerothrix sp. 4228-RoL]MDT8897620.1 type III-B CRISPR module-associated protein Cmr5 [Thermanaerothrix sp. 4228-RoL]
MTETVSKQRLLEQERASHAYEEVTKAKGKKDKELKSLARSAPASIQSNGLGQTLAFWKAKKEVPLYDALSGWLKNQLQIDDNRDLLEWIATTATSLQYRQATAEALAYLNWYKRFAEAELPDAQQE